MPEPDITTFALPLAEVDTHEAGRVTARLVPYGVDVPYGATRVRFERGGLTLPESVPLTIDHGESVRDRIGVLEAFNETDDGAYASFRFFDTEAAQEVRTIITGGGASDVSIGVASPRNTPNGEHSIIQSGILDHVSVVAHGRFNSTRTGRPARVLSIHEQEGNPMPDITPDPVVEQHDDRPGNDPATIDYVDRQLAVHAQGMRELAEAIAAAAPTPTVDNPLMLFSAESVLDYMIARRLGWDRTADELGATTIATHALADVIGDLGAADASGLSPDFYTARVQQNIDRRRPLFAAGGSATFPAYGNNAVGAKVTQEVTVGSGKAQKAETSSQALEVEAVTFPVVFHSGAVDIAYELIRQSSPSVLRVVRNSMMRAYAGATNEDAADKVQAAGVHTTAALDTTDYASLVAQIITFSNLIEDATGLPGDRLAVTPAQWALVLGMMDGGDRRQFAISGAENSDGSAGLTARGINVGGVIIFRDPSVDVALQFNTESFARSEDGAIEVSTDNVTLMGKDVGIIGATVCELWDEGIYSYEA